jgi:serine/threonine protein phosphatase PrpC
VENQLTYISNSIKGIRRDKNQDRILIIEDDNYYFFIIFDGVSSYPESYLYIEKYIAYLNANYSEFLAKPEGNIDKLLYNAHKSLVSSSIGGCTTIAALFFSKSHKIAKYINIGDSRIYIYSELYIEKITIDDNIPEMPNILTRSLGPNYLSFDDFHVYEIEKEHNFLLCTDGFYALMEEDLYEYFNTINHKDLDKIRKQLSLLQQDKNYDDSSYILIKNKTALETQNLINI